MSKTILLTGANGFIAGHIKTRLLELGYKVIEFTRADNSHIYSFRATGIDTIINCAAELSRESEMFDSNVKLVNNLLDFSQKERIAKFIQIGSSSETGPTDSPRKEDTFCSPTTIYEATKLAGTVLCLAYAKAYDMDICVARPFSIYGPGETPRKFIPQLWEALINGKIFELYPGGHDFIFIDDFVDGIIALLDAPQETTKGQIFNFGSGRSFSNAEVLGVFQELASEMLLGRTVTFHLNGKPYRPYDVENWQADITKSMTRLNWKPKTSLKEGLKKYIYWAWFQSDLG